MPLQEAIALSTQSNLRIYPAPVEEEPATDYDVTVNGQPVFTHRARVSAGAINQLYPGYQRPLDQTEIASFASWDMAEPVDVCFVSHIPVKEVRVRPTSRGIEPTVNGDTISFTIQKPGQFTVEVNGTHHALHLFADPIAGDAPNAEDPDVIHFGPGVHCAGTIRPKSNQTVYIAGGAVVYGVIAAEYEENITITGRGILDGSKFSRPDANAIIFLAGCENVHIDGITLRDPNVFAVTPVMCRYIHIMNVKLIGNWRYNSDGIDFVSCRHCSVEDSFVRAFDDCIVFKGYENWGPFIHKVQSLHGEMIPNNFTVDGVNRISVAEMQKRYGKYHCNAVPVHDMQVRRCVIWNDWGKALEIGLETVASEISNMLFEDCDIIHVIHIAMSVHNTDRATVRDIIYRNIRVELDNNDARIISIENIEGWCSHDDERGHVEDISYEDIEVTGPGRIVSDLLGADAEHLVQRISIQNLRINGRVATSVEEAGFQMNEFVKDISFVEGPVKQ